MGGAAAAGGISPGTPARRPRPRPGRGTVQGGRRSRACRRRRSQEGGITGCGGGFGSPLGVGGGPRWPAGGGAPAVGDAHRSALPGTADTRRFPSAGITVPHISSRGTMTQVQPAFSARSHCGRRGFTGRCRCSVIGQYGAARGQVHPFFPPRSGDLPARPGELRRGGLERVVSGDPFVDLGASPPQRRALAAPGCGGASPGARSSSPVDPGGRPAPRARRPVWRLAWRPCRTGSGRAELSVGSVEPG